MTPKAWPALRQHGARKRRDVPDGGGRARRRPQRLRQASLRVATPEDLRLHRRGERCQPAVRIEEDARFGEDRREVHVAEHDLGVGDAPRLVEGRFEHHAAEGQLAGGEAAVRLEDLGRNLGVDVKEQVHVRAGRVRFLRIARAGGPSQDGAHQLRVPPGLFAQPCLCREPRFTGGDHQCPLSRTGM
ncbi:MAG: hypothetical protein AB9869_23160 [Verrucomicrobiia bacterium]